MRAIALQERNLLDSLASELPTRQMSSVDAYVPWQVELAHGFSFGWKMVGLTIFSYPLKRAFPMPMTRDSLLNRLRAEISLDFHKFALWKTEEQSFWAERRLY